MSDPYTPKIGDTVRWGASTQTFTVRTDVFNFHVAATQDDDEATLHLFHVADLVKVEPTPADRYLVLRDDLSRETGGAVTTDVEYARVQAGIRGHLVAQFTFVKFVEPAEGEL